LNKGKNVISIDAENPLKEIQPIHIKKLTEIVNTREFSQFNYRPLFKLIAPNDFLPS
jgi:hypothetical protein